MHAEPGAAARQILGVALEHERSQPTLRMRFAASSPPSEPPITSASGLLIADGRAATNAIAQEMLS